MAAYKQWDLWYMKMPEDENPWFWPNENEFRLAYFTLPMALNYQRNSYALREAALKTYNDASTKDVFEVQKVNSMDDEELREKLLKHKVALQPNKHIQTRKKISHTIAEQRGSIENMFTTLDNDFLKVQQTIQHDKKPWFPYLSWPKIFHYRSFIIQEYGDIKLKNVEYIEIAPYTHITKCSVKLWIITQEEVEKISKDELSKRRREALQWSWINPIEMHPPLWFWSRNNFEWVL